MKVTVKHWLMLSKDYEGKDRYRLYPFDMSNDEMVLVKIMDVELDIPDDFDPRPEMIANLEKQRNKAKADYEQLMNVIDGKIQSLRCIEHRPDLTNNETRGE